MQAPVLERRPEIGAIRWRDPSTRRSSNTCGRRALQTAWKPIGRCAGSPFVSTMWRERPNDSVKLSSRVARVLGETPAGFNYELFLDENGQRFQNQGNGLTIEQWLACAA